MLLWLILMLLALAGQAVLAGRGAAQWQGMLLPACFAVFALLACAQLAPVSANPAAMVCCWLAVPLEIGMFEVFYWKHACAMKKKNRV